MASETAFSGSDQHQLLPEPKPSLNSGSVVIRTLAAAVAGLFGAILSWKAIEYIGEVFVLPADLAGLAFGQIPAPEVQAKVVAATVENQIRNAAVWLGTAGAIMGAFSSLSICLSRRLRLTSFRMIFVTVLAGTLFGALAGVVGVWIDTVSRQNLEVGATSPSEHITLLMHSITWMIFGLGIGLGISFGGIQHRISRIESTVVIGLLGMVGGCLFPIAAAVLFPAVNSTWPVPAFEPTSGLILWLGLPYVLMGMAIGRNG